MIMKKIVTLFASTLLLLGCTNSQSPKLNFEGVYFNSMSYVYDGDARILHEVYGAPEGTTITYEGREYYTDSGVYPATALLSKKGYNDKLLSATLTITNASFKNIYFENKVVEYDGLEHSITVSNLPDFATVTYKNNVGTEVGAYLATAIVSAKNYDDLTLYAYLTITAPLKDFDDAHMDDVTVDYDGESHTIEPQGYPEGTKVTYKGTRNYTDAGTYTIKCTLSKEGYHDKDLSASLVINPIDFTGLVFEGDTCLYDGKSHSITVQNAPSGSTVSYRCTNATGSNTFINKGSYKIEASVKHKNYKSVTLTATLNIIDPIEILKFNEVKPAYIFEENPMWDDAFGEVMKMNYTLLIYSGSRAEDEEIVFDKDTGSYTIVACDGESFFYCYHSIYYGYDEYKFYNTVGDQAVCYSFRTDNIDGAGYYRMPEAAMDETIRKYYPARAFNTLQPSEDGHLITGIDLDDYYSGIGTFKVSEDGNKLSIKREHKRSDSYQYEMYEIYNVGNTVLEMPESIIPSEDEVEDINPTGSDFIIDGVEYGTHLVSTWNSPLEYMAHTYLYHWQQLILEPGPHFVYPEINGNIVRRVVYNYYSEVNIYNLNMNGYEVNVCFDRNGNYQGEYEIYGTVTDRTSGFTSHGGVVHYYGEW